jgi:hypothetical protein
METAKVGDRVTVESERVGKPTREGEVLEVLTRGPDVHYRIRWVDGHETVFYPVAGSLSIIGKGPRVGST